MEAVAPAVGRTEDAPSAHTRIEDREAFAALCERHFDGIFDFALRVVRSRDVAAAVVRRTFSQRSLSIGALYASARDHALEELRYRRRLDARAEEREGLDFTQVDADRLSDPSAVLFDRALIELVWDCAAVLAPAEYAALDLYVRRGLGPDELGESEFRLARLCDRFEDTATAMLLATRARHSCEGLESLLSEVETERGPTGRLRAARQHAGSCEVCRESKRNFVSPLEVFGSLAAIAPTRGLRESVWKQLQPRPNGRWTQRLRR